ncbi:MAG: antibiotic biosynthesis monooxygenase [Leptotrichiaceae bacterium]|nr:antibiotic biosynthesis monooxygenase [Leptotrichiaceae bacterium]
MSIITELVTLKSINNVTRDEFISIVDSLEKNFHSKQDGFIDTELLYDEKKNTWIMIQHWETAEHLKIASKKIFSDNAAKSFIKCVDPESVKIVITTQIEVWK